jgi:hypothetical protein
MIAEPVAAAGPSADRPADLFDFFEKVRTTNPFLNNRVDRALDPSFIDVPAIHEAAFDTVVGLGKQALAEDRGLGVVVWGEAGMGKSHLLARLNRATDAKADLPLIYLHNLQASPERLPRTVLRAVLQRLTRSQVRPFFRSPLFALLNAVLRIALERQGRTRGTWPQITAAYGAFLTPLAERDTAGGALFDSTVYEVLYQFYRAAHPGLRGAEEDLAALAVRWLSGEALDAEEARRLGLPAGRDPEGPVALADNQHVKQVLVALAQLARAAGRLLLLCFDQVDNLDEDQVKALARFLHDLLDSAGSLLIVTTGVKHTLLGFQQRGVITETSWDRIGQFEVTLGRLQREQGYPLLRARLLHFLEPFRGLKEIEERLREDPLFPLGVAWFDARLRDLPDFRPRDLLGWACDRWQQLQHDLASAPNEDWLKHRGEAPKPPPPPSPEDPEAARDRLIAERLGEHQALLLREPARLAVDADRLLALIEAALKQAQGGAYHLRTYRRHPIAKSGARGPYDLTVEQATAAEGPRSRVGVRVLAPEHPRNITTALERIIEADSPPERALLVTDERQELRPGKKGAELLAELEQRGPDRFLHFKVSLRQLAELDALQTVVGMARAGDLEVETAPGQRRAVTEEEVIAAHHRAGRYLAHPLLRELLGGPIAPAPAAAPAPPAAVVPADLDVQDARQFLMAKVALSGPVSVEELATLFVAERSGNGRPVLDVRGCAAALEQVARRLAAEGKLQATSGEHGLTLAPVKQPEAAAR